MKKVSVILIMIGFVLPSHAQLGFRTLWEKPVGNSFSSEWAIGKPFSQQLSGGAVVFSVPYRPCASKCSTTVMNRTIVRDSTFKRDALYSLNNSLDYYPFKSEYYIQIGGGTDSQTGNFYYTTSIYDANGELKADFRRTNYSVRVGLLTPNSRGGFIVSLHQNGFDVPDSVLSINSQGKVNWRQAIPSFELDLPDTDYHFVPTDTPLYLENQIAYISKREVRSKSNLSVLISSSKRLILADSTGEKWNTEVDATTGTTQVIGQDNRAQLVVLTAKDTVGLLSKFDLKGQKTDSFFLKFPAFYNVNNISFQSTPDNGFLLYRKNQYTPDITKFGSNGQREWQFSGYPFIDCLKVYANGNIFGYTTYYGDYKLFLLAPNGNPIFSGGIINHITNAEGWTYFTTSDKLYAVTPAGDLAWSVQRPTSYAVLSLDRDGELLMTENVATPNANAALFLKAVGLDFINTFKLSKYSHEGKRLWQMPIAMPVENPNLQVRFLGGTYPSGSSNEDYLMTQLLITQSQSAAIGNLNNFSHTIFVTGITRPCYQQIEADLKTSTTTLCTGQKLQLTSNADSLNLLSYQWQRNGQSLSTTRTPVYETAEAGTYRVTLRDSVCGTSFVSNAVTVTARSIQTPTVISSGSTDFCAGSDFATLTTASINPELRYQWVRNGQVVGGLFQNSLKVTEGGTYQLSAHDTVCNATVLSSGVSINVRPLPEATVTPEVNGAVYAPFKAKLKANEGAGLTYQWLKEGVELAGATGSVYEAGESGNYAVRVSREGCSQLSQTLRVTILQPLGVETPGVAEWNIYPNPNRGEFKLELSDSSEKSLIEILDLTGRSVSFQKVGNRIRLEASPGVYCLRVISAQSVITKRLVILSL
ncbi:MAG: T9SS type A sorting domain-containing protein [Spirosomataceae bacterium]